MLLHKAADWIISITGALIIISYAIVHRNPLIILGSISLYALFLPFLLAYEYRGLKEKALLLLLLLVLSVVTGGWRYIYVRVADPQSFLSIASEEVGNWSSYNVRPFYFYWGFFAQSGLWTIPALISLLYPLKKRVANLKAYRFNLL